ncbi:ste-12 alpha [Moniliophthora roreri MCA 2997]|uniref:Ste-12 alpha n=2 Tax=Moniliophthora roreri TaxID=221103 RepID=V2X9Q9_MONRO|nr:ste-12 alpha [Moniliophthora roreri MCA 2997]KAI3609853.1 ste-12 alpha [Moniliophthora roreri]
MHPRHSLQLDVGIPPHEHDPQEYTARPRANNQDHLLDFDHHHASSSSQQSTSSAAPGLPRGLSRPLTHQEQEKLAALDRLKFFLATAPSRWNTSQSGSTSQTPQHHPHTPTHPALNRFLLPSQEFVTCVLWNGLYHITGTDIVRALVFRFEAFGRPVRNMKKFEEGVFSDLRNLKPGQDACLEEPKSQFLDLLFKYQCIRTQKKQKVFYWFSVPHDRLFLDALERDLKREKMGLEPTTVVVGEPAASFVYDGTFKRSLYDQFVRAAGGREGEGDLERALRGLEDPTGIGSSMQSLRGGNTATDDDSADSSGISDAEGQNTIRSRPKGKGVAANGTPVFEMISLFGGSPTYKQRRKKTTRPSPLAVGNGDHGYDAGAYTSGDNHLGVPINMGIAMPTLPSSAPPLSSSFGSSDYSESRGRYPDRRNAGIRDATSMSSERYPYDGGLHYSYDGPSSYPNGSIKQEPISAADMFLAQARGELPAPPRQSTSQNKRHSYAGSTGNSASYGVPPGAVDPASVGVWYDGKFAGSGIEAGKPEELQRAQSAHGFVPRTAAQGQTTSVADEEAAVEKRATAYQCPLLSCGRLFKSVDYLKKHLASHGNAAATQISKKPDGGGEREFEMMNVGEWLNQGMDDDEAGSGTSPAGSAASKPKDANGDVEMPESGDGTSTYSAASMASSVAASQGSLEMCEVELEGDIVEVSGDEEGLVRVSTSSGYSMNSQEHDGNSGEEPQERYYDAQRFTFNVPSTNERQPPSRTSSYDEPYNGSYTYYPAHVDSSQPSYNSVPSSALGAQQRPQFSASQSYTDSHPQGSASRPQSGVFDLSVYDATSGGSVSAPSHKLAFDHGSLYPPGMPYGSGSESGSVSSSYSSNTGIHSAVASPAMPVHTLSMDSGLNGLTGSPHPQPLLLGSSHHGGPVRRHRSMTPNLYGSKSHSRPLTSSGPYPSRSPSRGRHSPGSGSEYGVSSVGYHPYAGGPSRSSPHGHGSVMGSAHSSPATGQRGIGLPPRSDSRASNLMRPGSSASMSSVYGGDMYRTESPTPYMSNAPGAVNGMVTDSPAAYVMDLPAMNNNTAIFGHNVPPQHPQQHSHTIASTNDPAYHISPPYGRGHAFNGENGAGYYPQHVSTM